MSDERKPPGLVLPFRQQPPIPNDWELATAIEFLRLNEGDGGEAEACAAVAAWIEAVTGIRQRWPQGGIEVEP